ncbi:hypothetical protein JRC49_07990 [Clostridiales bacterium FE2011]|jgi:hypothetical protein|nr:hypothetical protein JRC49_07990 [Clostridiales bacterium FE2011]
MEKPSSKLVALCNILGPHGIVPVFPLFCNMFFRFLFVLAALSAQILQSFRAFVKNGRETLKKPQIS